MVETGYMINSNIDNNEYWEQNKELSDIFIPQELIFKFANLKIVSEGYYQFSSFSDDDYYNEHELYGISDQFGNVIVAPYFDDILSIKYNDNIYFITIIHEGIYGIEESYLYDQNGNEIDLITLRGGFGYLNGCYISKIYKFKIDNNYMLISNNGKIIIPPLYDEVENLESPFWFKVKKNNLWGIWKENSELHPPIYNDIYLDYSYTLKTYGIIIKEKEKFGFTDFSGNFIKPQYEKIETFDDNYLAIKELNRWGIINRKKETIILPQYEKIIYGGKLFIAQKNFFYGCVNHKNEIVIPFIYDQILYDHNIYDDYETLWAKRKNKIYKLKIDGTIVSESIFIKDYSLGYNELEIVLEHDSKNINLFTDIEHINVSKF